VCVKGLIETFTFAFFLPHNVTASVGLQRQPGELGLEHWQCFIPQSNNGTADQV